MFPDQGLSTGQTVFSSIQGSHDILVSFSLALDIGSDCNRPTGRLPELGRVLPACLRFLSDSSQHIQPQNLCNVLWLFQSDQQPLSASAPYDGDTSGACPAHLVYLHNSDTAD